MSLQPCDRLNPISRSRSASIEDIRVSDLHYPGNPPKFRLFKTDLTSAQIACALTTLRQVGSMNADLQRLDPFCHNPHMRSPFSIGVCVLNRLKKEPNVKMAPGDGHLLLELMTQATPWSLTPKDALKVLRLINELLKNYHDINSSLLSRAVDPVFQLLQGADFEPDLESKLRIQIASLLPKLNPKDLSQQSALFLFKFFAPESDTYSDLRIFIKLKFTVFFLSIPSLQKIFMRTVFLGLEQLYETSPQEAEKLLDKFILQLYMPSSHWQDEEAASQREAHLDILNNFMNGLTACSSGHTDFKALCVHKFCSLFDGQKHFKSRYNRANRLNHHLWAEIIRSIEFKDHLPFFVECLRIHFYYMRVAGNATLCLDENECVLLIRLASFFSSSASIQKEDTDLFFLIFSSAVQADNFSSLWACVSKGLLTAIERLPYDSTEIYLALSTLRKLSLYQTQINPIQNLVLALEQLIKNSSGTKQKLAKGLLAHFTQKEPQETVSHEELFAKEQEEHGSWGTIATLNLYRKTLSSEQLTTPPRFLSKRFFETMAANLDGSLFLDSHVVEVVLLEIERIQRNMRSSKPLDCASLNLILHKLQRTNAPLPLVFIALGNFIDNSPLFPKNVFAKALTPLLDTFKTQQLGLTLTIQLFDALRVLSRNGHLASLPEDQKQILLALLSPHKEKLNLQQSATVLASLETLQISSPIINTLNNRIFLHLEQRNLQYH